MRLDLDSPLLSSEPVLVVPEKTPTVKRNSRKRSYSEVRDVGRKITSTPTKRRKSLEGYIVEERRTNTPTGKSFRHVKNRKNVFELSDFDFKKFCTPPMNDRPLQLFPHLSSDTELSTPKTPFSDKDFVDITDLKSTNAEEGVKDFLDLKTTSTPCEYPHKLETPKRNRYLKDLASLASSLNFKRGKFDNVKNISCQNVRDLLIDDQIPGNYAIFDCRFEYEYYGGHLRTSVKCTTRQDVEKLFSQYEEKPEMKFILHCEHSACRAPRSADYLACLFDRYVGHQPEIYVMQGGYAKFWKLFGKEKAKDKIFERHGYVKETAHKLKCRLFRSKVSDGWNKVLVACDIDDDCLLETFC